MTNDLQNPISYLIEKYIRILKENGEPGEAYKYLAINTFQQNWNLDSEDFYQMFRNSFGKVANLLYQTSRGFIEKSAELFPEETRAMFRNLYDESVEVSKRITAFQTESENLLLKLQQALNRTNIKAQQDERTISVYLAFRFPEKYTLYKADYYENFCEELQIKDKKAGNRFLHLQELADEIIRKGLLENEKLMNNYRKFYPKPDWNDAYLVIQNILYITFKKRFIEMSEKFKLFYNEIKQYIETNELKYKLGRKGKEWVWVFDEQEYFNNDYVHYEFLLNENQVSIDLHFEKNKKIANELHSLCEPLPDFLEWKTWQKSVQSITHKNKIDLESPNRTKESIEALNELYNRTYPLLVEKAKSLKVTTKNSDPIKSTEESMKNMNLTPNIPLNQILFGAPGTGKTYHTKKIAVEIINGKKERTRKEINEEFETLTNAKQIVFTTFHQSLSYEDFIEGIKPETTDGKVTYEVKGGIFKRLCSRAIEQKSKNNGIEIYDFDKAWNDLIAEAEQFFLSNSQLLLSILTPDKGLYVTEITDNGNLKVKPKNSRLDIDYTVSYNRAKKLQEAFPDLSVVKNIDKEFRYVIGGSNSTAYWAVLNFINNRIKENYKVTTIPKENKNYVLIVDEINRGNVSAIFGELITLLEEDKRKGNPEQTEVVLPYSGNKFSVPNNVYIIGTMNTADRSVEALDTALRRRFSFVEMQPNPEILSEEEYKNVDLPRLLATINQRIEVLIDKDHQIGHSYFIGIQNLEDLKGVFRDKIIPLLEEYFYGDFGKIGLVLGGKFIHQKENKALFPKNFTYENDFLEDKKIYRFAPFESWNEETFKSVYED
ncbi:McrB family protein [Capnocytophaga canis]|uniref:ATPase associated with various cellular activities AAA_5 n=1 Tax=Capnocytophaga canis TaxID=1848903 RepID=A0A0B7IVU3_9FLAO|nr:AAA family ATPase [Capnocytophaga canis]CEN54073.1 ATPase associated with various cellular activities AAA_5 [Capnocytophaga canis]